MKMALKYLLQVPEPEPEKTTLTWPVPGYSVGSSEGAKFGMRLHPIKQEMVMHNGIDIPAPSGTPIYAPLGGVVVVNACQAGGAGNYITIDHGNGLGTVYMHMLEKSPLSIGSVVAVGQQIGRIGTTGASTGNHLHFEVHENFSGATGTPVDPLGYTYVELEIPEIPEEPETPESSIQITKKLLSSSLDGSHYSSTPQTQQWIVIHNTGGGNASSAYNWFNNPSNTAKTSAHYCVDDTQIIQCLEDNWKGHHCGGSGIYYNDEYRPSNSEECTNSNSIGIEVADWGGRYTSEQFNKAIENAIDLTINLMKKHNIDANHVIRHGDTQNKSCPIYIMKENKWGYFKEQLINRTGRQY